MKPPQAYLKKNPFRWVYRFFFAILFFGLASLLIASSNGIMYNPKSQTFESTGLIAIVADNPPITLTVDGVSQTSKDSEVKVANLFAGLHTVEVSKPGYFTWQKVDTVRPGQAIVHNGVRLFMKEPVIRLASTAQKAALVENMAGSKSESDFDIRGNELWVKPITATYPVTTIGSEFVLVGRYSQPIISAQWFVGKHHLVMQIGGEIRVIDRDGSNDIVLATLESELPTDFMVTDDGENLIYVNGDVVQVRPL